MEDAYQRERGADVRGLGNRVLGRLQAEDPQTLTYVNNTILVSEELTPADLALVPRDKLAGFVSVRGSGNSHVAILAEAMGVPTVMGAEELPTELLDGKPLIVDGFAGMVITYPKDEEVDYYQKIMQEEADLVEGLGVAQEPCRSLDGHRVGIA